jgi:hypothetical protein
LAEHKKNSEIMRKNEQKVDSTFFPSFVCGKQEEISFYNCEKNFFICFFRDSICEQNRRDVPINFRHNVLRAWLEWVSELTLEVIWLFILFNHPTSVCCLFFHNILMSSREKEWREKDEINEKPPTACKYYFWINNILLFWFSSRTYVVTYFHSTFSSCVVFSPNHHALNMFTTFMYTHVCEVVYLYLDLRLNVSGKKEEMKKVFWSHKIDLNFLFSLKSILCDAMCMWKERKVIP